ncbi:MAG: tRNA lysidine(34) synthetase TilS [Candidatus Omnitrophica bacterium]|jgi:tRNA(Ile)-lysidine synthase|nr:tRNA lysidine(34) synthetase TilS [Candidatus Omnitrophota bacterium]MDD5661065.1 tRNA lysidine(34) synthetase TilS [Candidatus Omnitrophota bacterium]
MDKFTETIKKHSLIKEGDKILIGVSGGPDSLTLLFKLAALKSSMGLDLHIAHVDHNLRKDSGADVLFVKKLAGNLNIPISVKTLDQSLVKKRGSLEEICREERLAFFTSTAKRIKADKVALGHNLDDQAETVLMRLLRGTGLSGLSGISVKRNIRGVIFIRPLLETPRSQIDKFLKRKGVKARVDSTNRQEIFLRNSVRHKLIPLLKKNYNRNIVGLLANLAQSASYDYEYLDRMAKRSAGGNIPRLELKKIIALHPAILRLKLRQSIGYIQGDTRRISFIHIQEIEDLILSRPTGSIVDLPKGISVQKTRHYLRFFKR